MFGRGGPEIWPVSDLGPRAEFSLGGGLTAGLAAAGYQTAAWLLPSGTAVAQRDRKLVVAGGAKAGSVKLVEGRPVDVKESANPSGRQLTLVPKTGELKGSFSVFALDGRGKLKKLTAAVSGILLDGVGFGTATIKKIGSAPVEIGEPSE